MFDGSNDGLLYVGIALLLTAFGLWLYSRGEAARRLSGLPKGQVIGGDHGQWQRSAETLFAPAVGLTGKPDYLVQQPDGSIVPVEIKTRAAPSQPYETHVMQLAAYCYLVHTRYGIRPNHGIIQYADRAFAVKYTPVLEQQLLSLITMMQEDAYRDDVPRSHDNPRQCASCSVRDFCDDRLA
jgi:CRISPR-associated exonuclease Cas4